MSIGSPIKRKIFDAGVENGDGFWIKYLKFLVLLSSMFGFWQLYQNSSAVFETFMGDGRGDALVDDSGADLVKKLKNTPDAQKKPKLDLNSIGDSDSSDSYLSDNGDMPLKHIGTPDDPAVEEKSEPVRIFGSTFSCFKLWREMILSFFPKRI